MERHRLNAMILVKRRTERPTKVLAKTSSILNCSSNKIAGALSVRSSRDLWNYTNPT